MSGGKTYVATWWLKHNLYIERNGYVDYDVGLIGVPRMDLDGIYATSVPLIGEGFVIPPNTLTTVTGWGRTIEGGSASGILLETIVLTLSNPDCQDKFTRRKTNLVTERMFCAGLEEGGRGPCQGDSGGPVVSNGRQLGVVSSGIGCARPNSPGFFTNITNMEIRRWIRRNSGV